jgi:hypothetical protein
MNYEPLDRSRLNNRALKYMKQKLTQLKGETDNLTIIVRDFNALLSIMDRTTGHKIKHEINDLYNTASQLNQILKEHSPNSHRIQSSFFTNAHEHSPEKIK